MNGERMLKNILALKNFKIDQLFLENCLKNILTCFDLSSQIFNHIKTFNFYGKIDVKIDELFAFL